MLTSPKGLKTAHYGNINTLLMQSYRSSVAPNRHPPAFTFYNVLENQAS